MKYQYRKLLVQTHIYHKLSTATAKIFMYTALRLNNLLDIFTNMPASPFLHAPCIHKHLRGSAIKTYEKSGLNLDLNGHFFVKFIKM